MLAEAADIVATRQRSKKRPRTVYSDYREMLTEKDLDIVLIATPDHWHALTMIAAVEAGRRCVLPEADQRGCARRPGHAGGGAQVRARGAGGHAAPQHAAPGRSARSLHSSTGKLGKIGSVDIYCYYHMRATSNPPDTAPAAESRLRDVDRARAHAAVTTRWCIREAGARSWSTATGSWATCASTCSTWLAGCWGSAGPSSISSAGGILVDKASKANITDTQTATFDYRRREVVWQHRTWGDPPDPKYPWGATFYGDKGTLKASVYSYDFIPAGRRRSRFIRT